MRGVQKLIFILTLFNQSGAIVFGTTEIDTEKLCGFLPKTQIGLESLNFSVPWTATITGRSETRPDFTFAALIISENLLLTYAGHFIVLGTSRFQILPPSKYFVNVGTTKFGDLTSSAQENMITHVQIHPKYHYKVWPAAKYPFALLHLAEPLNITENVQPICLPNNKTLIDLTEIPGENNLMLVGWNRNDEDLLSLRLSIQNPEVCRNYWENENETNEFVYENRYCALVDQLNDHTNCIHRDVAAAVEIDGIFYFAGLVNNFYDNNRTRVCSEGALYYFISNDLDTFAWIENNTRCGPENFTCSNGECISLDGLCDQYENCSDGSDENKKYCRGLNFCTDDEFACGVYGKCIPLDQVLDGNLDCEYGEDEVDINESNSKPYTNGLFIGTLVVVLVFLIVLTISCYYIHVLRKRLRDLTEEEVKEFRYGSLCKDMNSDNGSRSKNISSINAASCVKQTVQNMPWNAAQYEIPLSELEMKNEISKGKFGVVYKALFIKNQRDVAVKLPLPSVGIQEFKALLLELKILAYIGSDENVIRLVGACTEKIRQKTIYVVMEYCANGDLKNFLVEHAFYFSDICLPSANKEYIQMEYFSGQDLIKWLYQIASGLTFLSSKEIVHGDVAARNVLLSARLDAKVSDFGLSRQLNGSGIYVKTSRDPVPYKWLSPESLQSNIYCEKSDVWSFGVTMWELYSLGQDPYPDKKWGVQFMNDLLQGVRLRQPQYAGTEMYTIMKQCWDLNSENRPDFSQLKAVIGQLYKPELDNEYMNT